MLRNALCRVAKPNDKCPDRVRLSLADLRPEDIKRPDVRDRRARVGAAEDSKRPRRPRKVPRRARVKPPRLVEEVDGRELPLAQRAVERSARGLGGRKRGGNRSRRWSGGRRLLPTRRQRRARRQTSRPAARRQAPASGPRQPGTACPLGHGQAAGGHARGARQARRRRPGASPQTPPQRGAPGPLRRCPTHQPSRGGPCRARGRAQQPCRSGPRGRSPARAPAGSRGRWAQARRGRAQQSAPG